MFVLRVNQDRVINENGNILITDMTGSIGDVTYVPREDDSSVYLEKINETGYGGENPLRDDISLTVYGLKLELDADSPVEFKAYAGSASQWEAIIKEDGVYRFWIGDGVNKSDYVEFPYLVNAGRMYTKLVSKRVDLLIRECSDRDINMVSRAIGDIEAGIYAMEYEFTKGNKINAIRISNYLNGKNYKSILEL